MLFQSTYEQCTYANHREECDEIVLLLARNVVAIDNTSNQQDFSVPQILVQLPSCIYTCTCMQSRKCTYYHFISNAVRVWIEEQQVHVYGCVPSTILSVFTWVCGIKQQQVHVYLHNSARLIQSGHRNNVVWSLELLFTFGLPSFRCGHTVLLYNFHLPMFVSTILAISKAV